MGPGQLATFPVRLCAYGFQTLCVALRHCIDTLAVTAFWGTILLPLAIVWTLVTGAADPHLLGGLVGTNLVCIPLGQRHRPEA